MSVQVALRRGGDNGGVVGGTAGDDLGGLTERAHRLLERYEIDGDVEYLRWAYLCGSPVVQWWCVVGFGCSPIGAGFVGPGLESRLGRRPTRQGLVLTPVGSDGYCCDRERPRSAVHGWYSRVVRAAWWCGRAPWLTSVHGPLLVVLARRHDDGLGVPRWVRPLILWRSSPAREWRGDSPMAGAGRGRISVESVPGAHRCAAEGVQAASCHAVSPRLRRMWCDLRAIFRATEMAARL